MKSKKINFTRRSFIKNVTSVTAGIGLCGNKIWGAPAYIPNLLKPNSKINGVQQWPGTRSRWVSRIPLFPYTE